MPRVVVGVDESPAAAAAARFAVEESRARRWPLTAVLCWSRPGQHGGRRGDDDGEGARRLHVLVGRALGADATAVDRYVDLVDFAADGLLGQVGHGDLLVVGRGRPGVTGSLLHHSVARAVIPRSPCPVAVVPSEAPAPPRGRGRAVVVGVDGSTTSRAALRWGLAEARARGTSVAVVHAWQVPLATGVLAPDPRDPVHRARAQARLDAMVVDLPVDGRGVEVEPVLVEGDAADVLAERSALGDLVVVGTTGLGGVVGLVLGSTAQRLSMVTEGAIVLVPSPTT